MNNRRSIIAIAMLAFAPTALAVQRPKYVFVFIGDGMSTPQRMVAEEFAEKTGHGELAMNRLPYQVNTRTRSANSVITDSAAAATAIACGVKTNNGMLGVLPDGAGMQFLHVFENGLTCPCRLVVFQLQLIIAPFGMGDAAAQDLFTAHIQYTLHMLMISFFQKR